MTPECREMFTRRCPISGCENLPCARYHDENESRWDLDKIEWDKAINAQKERPRS